MFGYRLIKEDKLIALEAQSAKLYKIKKGVHWFGKYTAIHKLLHDLIEDDIPLSQVRENFEYNLQHFSITTEKEEYKSSYDLFSDFRDRIKVR